MRQAIRWALAAMLVIPSPAMASDEWLPVRETSMILGAGSPLDFSAFLPNPPIDSGNQLVTGKQGRLVRASEPDKPVNIT